jgi:glutamine---fructose-6-phosphate transaminase (isomerizing)
LAITNVDDSTMAREAMAPSNRGGPRTCHSSHQELYSSTVEALLLALMSAGVRGAIDSSELVVRLGEVAKLLLRIQEQLKGRDDAMRQIVEEYRAAMNFLFLGRGLHYSIAREGTLKLKESAYLHAEGYPSG